MGTVTQQSEADTNYQHELSKAEGLRKHHPQRTRHTQHTQHTKHTQRRANAQLLQISEIAEGLDASSALVVVKLPVCALDTGWGQTDIWRVKGKATEDLHFQINLINNILYFLT